MKRALLISLIIAPLNLLAQEIVLDSVQYIKNCKCERSITWYKDFDNRKYHVYFDSQRDEFFRLKREKNYFRKEVIDWMVE